MLDDRQLRPRVAKSPFMAFIIITGSLMTLRLAILLLSMQFRRFILASSNQNIAYIIEIES